MTSTIHSQTPDIEHEPLTFETRAVEVLSNVRSAIAEFIAAVPGNVKRAADLQRALEIRKMLAWQLFKVANAANPLTEAKKIPGPGAMQHAFDAAAACGMPVAKSRSVLAALEEFDAFVRSHAGDRSSFVSMVSALGGTNDQLVDIQNRRVTFRGQSHIWGVQAETQLSCFFYQPSTVKLDQIDAAGIRGLIQLRRLRRDVSWVIARTRVADDDGVIRHPVGMEPLDPSVDPVSGVALLREFCSDPIPPLRCSPQASGIVDVELTGDTVGNESAVTCLIGNSFRNFTPRYKDEHNHAVISQTAVRTPCEVLVHDVIVHEDLFGSITPEVSVYGDHRDVDPAPQERACDLLAQRESVVYLGKGPSVLHTPDVPRYPEMVQYAFDRLGWDGEKFDVYRCRVAYPVMPSSLVVQFDLPEKP